METRDMKGTVRAIYFSPTGASGKIASAVAKGMASKLGLKFSEVSLTYPQERGTEYLMEKKDVLVFGFPVYAGRVPEFLVETMKNLRGEGTPAVVTATYGNRDYDDALLEASDILKEQGFDVIAAGAFIGEHSLTRKVATGRPDEVDLEVAAGFADAAAARISDADAAAEVLQIRGNRPYKPRNPSASAGPGTSDACTKCMICAEKCPMGIISREDPAVVADGCIRCCSCVKSCPVDAKSFSDEMFFKIKGMLEAGCTARKEPELFV